MVPISEEMNPLNSRQIYMKEGSRRQYTQQNSRGRPLYASFCLVSYFGLQRRTRDKTAQTQYQHPQLSISVETFIDI